MWGFLETGNSCEFLLVSWLTTSGIEFGLSAKSLVTELLISREPWRAWFTRPYKALLPMANRRFVLIKGLSRLEGNKDLDEGVSSYTGKYRWFGPWFSGDSGWFVLLGFDLLLDAKVSDCLLADRDPEFPKLLSLNIWTAVIRPVKGILSCAEVQHVWFSGCQGEWITESEIWSPYIGPDDAILSRIGVLDEFITEKGMFSSRNIHLAISQLFVDRFGWNQRQHLGENEENKMYLKRSRGLA